MGWKTHALTACDLARVGCLVVVSSWPAWAEVMDKEPTLDEVWIGSAIGTVLAFVAGRVHPFLGVLAIFHLLNPAFIALCEIDDPFVGPAIAREAGHSYIVQVQMANVMVVLGYLLGILLWRWSRPRSGAAQGPHRVVRTSP